MLDEAYGDCVGNQNTQSEMEKVYAKKGVIFHKPRKLVSFLSNRQTMYICNKVECIPKEIQFLPAMAMAFLIGVISWFISWFNQILSIQSGVIN